MPVRIPSISTLRPLGLAPAIFAALSCAPRSSDPSQPPPPISSAQSTPLIVEPSPISLGTLDPGVSASADVIVRNLRNEAIGPTQIRTSCPCVVVRPNRIELGPRGFATLRIEFDPKEDPDFRGRLSVEIHGSQAADGKQNGGQLMLKTTVDIDVRAANSINDSDRSGT